LARWISGYAMTYDSSTGLAPWQDDFFTSSIGHMVELGFTNAQPLLTWKSKFPVDRMVGDGYCWIQAPAYSLKVRDSCNARSIRRSARSTEKFRRQRSRNWPAVARRWQPA
jgi:hypothetical protein